jgi:hypothetical protein
MNSQEPFECETESDKLAQLYMKLNATSQQDALNRIADLKQLVQAQRLQLMKY